jgi:hypothetical protein
VSKKGKAFVFHGAYEHKKEARAKERELKRRGLEAFVRHHCWKIRGRTCRFLVLTARKEKERG